MGSSRAFKKDDEYTSMIDLSNTQINDFERDGFLVIKNVFNSKEIDEIKSLYDQLLNEASKYNRQSYFGDDAHFIFENSFLNRIVWCGGRIKRLLEISEDERILRPVSTLLKTKNMTQIINQAHFKLPGEKIEFSWHQDSEHRRYGTELWKDVTGEGSYIQTVMAVDDMTEKNGPLRVIRGSHKHGHLNLRDNKNTIDNFPKEDILTLKMKEGDIVLFGPYLIHGSSFNETNHQRRVFINGYCASGANKKDYPGIGKGRELRLS